MWILLSLCLLFAAYLSPNLWYRKSPLIPNGENPILTFDDGPTEITEEVGRICAENGESCIFFVVAKDCDKFQDVLHTLVAQGHEIGYHCYDHIHPLRMSPWKRYEDLKKGYEILCALGFPPRYYRPPHGFYTFADHLFIHKRGLIPLHWTSLLKDWEKPPVEVLVDRMRSFQRTKALLVLHDGSRGSAVPDGYRQIPKVLDMYFQGGHDER